MDKSYEELTAQDVKLLSLLKPAPERSCAGCIYLTSKTCGRMVYEHLTSHSGTYKKIPDGRCERGS